MYDSVPLLAVRPSKQHCDRLQKSTYDAQALHQVHTRTAMKKHRVNSQLGSVSGLSNFTFLAGCPRAMRTFRTLKLSSSFSRQVSGFFLSGTQGIARCEYRPSPNMMLRIARGIAPRALKTSAFEYKGRHHDIVWST